MTEKSEKIIGRTSRDSLNKCWGCDPGLATYLLCPHTVCYSKISQFVCTSVNKTLCARAYESQPPTLWQVTLITLPTAGQNP